MSSAPGNRRLSAVLIADIAGYTKLVEQDTDGTVVAWTAARENVIDPKIAIHSGRIVKYTGDGFLAEFPNVQDAVECAIAMQAGLADSPLDFRMGVNLGDVVDDGTDIHGEGVNIAARIEALAEPGGICVSGLVYESVRNRIEAQFEDIGEHEVKHVSAPVRIYRIGSGDGEVAKAQTDQLELPDKPSIAVLPFDNMSGDPEQEFFSDGVTEDIITALSRYRSLFVIARNSTFSYKGQSPDLRSVSAELGVKFILEGSIRKVGHSIRVSAQLIEGVNGAHIWAERYDRQLDDIFALQDEITETIVAAIGPEIDNIERENAKRLPPENLDVWESYQRGLWHLYRFNKEDNAEAQHLFREAISKSSSFAPAYSGLTHALYYAFMHDLAEDRATLLEEAYEAGRSAVAADQRDADAHFALGRILYLRRDFEGSLSAFEDAVKHNSSFSHAHLGMGTALLFSGDWKAAIEWCDRAVRLSPNDPLYWIFNGSKALAVLLSDGAAAAEPVAREAVRHPRANVTVYLVLTSVLGHLENLPDAKDILAQAYRIRPQITEELVRQIFPFKNSEHSDYVLEGLRKAGFSG